MPRATRKKKSEPKDWGTPEIARRFTVVPRYSGPGNGFTGKVVDDSELDRLLYYDFISSLEHSILIALLKRLQRAQFCGIKSVDLQRETVGDPTRAADRKAQAVVGCSKLIAAMDKTMGHANRRALIDLVLLDQEWPFTIASLHNAVLALQRIFSDGQRPLGRTQSVEQAVALRMNGHGLIGA